MNAIYYRLSYDSLKAFSYAIIVRLGMTWR